MKHVPLELTTISDRWRYEIRYLGRHTEVDFSPTGTGYVMLNNCKSFTGPDVHIEDVSACVQTGLTCWISTGEGSAVIIDCPGFSHHEDRIFIVNELCMGNLSYMDGGTNTTAINPGRLGDPVINYVHFPAHMNQTLHTHPSQRIGLILKGNGIIKLDRNQEYAIHPGEAFLMERNELHNFTCQDEDVVLFVWAPDSGTGPTDEVNPLKTRTYIGQQFTK